MKYAVMMVGALALGGCATVTDGVGQDITLTSNAEGAMCSISQGGVEIVPASPVPATHTLRRQGGNLIVTCAADGYETETTALMAGAHPMTVTGVLLTGGLINIGTDMVSGAMHEYQDQAYIHLRKKSVL